MTTERSWGGRVPLILVVWVGAAGCGSGGGATTTGEATEIAVACIEAQPETCFEAAKAVMWGQGYDLGAAQAYLDIACRAEIGPACTDLGLVTARAALESPAAESGPPTRSAEEVQAYERACLLGDGQGCHELGLCHLDGAGCPADRTQAFQLFQQGCDLTWADACLRQGDLLGEDPSLSGRPAADFDKLACGHGALAGCDRLAGAHVGQGGDLSQAMDLQVVAMGLENGCNRQLAQSCFTLGQLNDRGWGVPRNRERSQELVEMACQMGYAPACHEKAARQVVGHQAVTAAPEEGMTLLAELCRTGYVPSCETLIEYADTVEGAAVSLQGVNLSSPSEVAGWTCQLGYQLGCDAARVLHR